ncbi:MAG: ATP-dependent DNA helicase [Burkholderiaceae bacterium]|nr:ATP-dependent DNA helicase [Burkholderiaceae bacterium]
MSPLLAAVVQAFSATGSLSCADPTYTQRDVQLRMAVSVADAIDARSTLVAEAGTGVGKTFAYLVPTLLSGARALVSTATKSLQDQLFLRDLPRLTAALGLATSVALLKGRASYLCTHRMKVARHSADLSDRWAVRTLSKIETWSHRTATGDLAEIEGLDERSSVIPFVTSTRENCVGSDCPDYRGCHLMRARRDAMAADVVVVNHHLFFADMTLRESGVAELLPSVEVAVFDEAHQLAEAGVGFLGVMLSSGQLIDAARDMLGVGLQQARGLAAWKDLAAACERAARELRMACVGASRAIDDIAPRPVRGSMKVRWDDRAPRPVFVNALEQVGAACAASHAALDMVSELSPDFAKLAERMARLHELTERFADTARPGQVRWIDVTTSQCRLVESPLDIREALRQQMTAAPKAWIFTSATLGDDDRLSWFTEPAGLSEAVTLRVGSPFNYAENARLYVPSRFPKPNEPDHAISVAQLAARCARALGGRTFVLTTTLRALQIIGERLRMAFEAEHDDLNVLVQGQLPKRQLIQTFLAQPRSVLVGSQTFWEGIDVPGDALQCVLIDKLPFPPPSDPLVEARVKRLESEGRNAFTDYFVAEAAVSLKQGAGRLIRSETDRGLLVVCDPRMSSMSYGKRLRQALPSMPRLETEGEAIDWLATLARDR